MNPDKILEVFFGKHKTERFSPNKFETGDDVELRAFYVVDFMNSDTELSDDIIFKLDEESRVFSLPANPVIQVSLQEALINDNFALAIVKK